MKSLQSKIQQNLDQLVDQLEGKEGLSLKEQQAIVKQLKKTSGYFQTLHKWIEAAQKISDFGSWEHYHQEDNLFWSEETYRIFGYEPYSVTPSF
ncbi:MAG: hypothetical protein GWN01_14675, partial [Nitrosopumilaceae archaeon]|nr:hypothetical protein [Nitrosopumilaceae archaeon]NIX62699.1 hypothetical protein [Nitrosopumilaceae archaeon]